MKELFGDQRLLVKAQANLEASIQTIFFDRQIHSRRW
jgi:hypothetical protein